VLTDFVARAEQQRGNLFLFSVLAIDFFRAPTMIAASWMTRCFANN
jgi:hypothetical protein